MEKTEDNIKEVDDIFNFAIVLILIFGFAYIINPYIVDNIDCSMGRVNIVTDVYCNN